MSETAALFLNELGTALVGVAVTFGFLLVLPARRPGLFVALRMLATLTIAFLRSRLPGIGALDLISCALLVLWLGKGPLRVRLLGLALGFMPMILGEAFGTALWIAATGMQSGTYEGAVLHPWVMLAVKIVFIAEELACAYVLGQLLRRALEGDGARRVVVRFLALPVVQSVLLVELLNMQLYEQASDQLFSWGVFLSAVLFLLTDLLALRYLEAARSAVLSEARARAKERRLEEYLRRYEEVTSAMAETARLRHDVRNHLQVVSALTGRGAWEEARSYVSQCEGWLGGGPDEGEGRSGEEGRYWGEGHPEGDGARAGEGSHA